MSDTPKPIRAKPVASPGQQSQQPRPQQPRPQTERKPATIDTLAYELFEIRRHLYRTITAKRKAGLLYLIWGGVFLVVGTLAAQTDKLGGTVAFIAGAVLMVVGSGMRCNPDDES